MNSLRFLLILLYFYSVAAPAQSIPPEKAFGARPDVESISLSPDGKRVAFVGPTTGQANALYVVDIAPGAQPRMATRSSGDPDRIGSCNWISNERLICNAYSVIEQRDIRGYLTRLVAVNFDGSDQKIVSNRDRKNATLFYFGGGTIIDFLPGQNGDVLLGRNHSPESDIGTLIKSDAQGYGVDRVNTVTLASKRVISPSPSAREYISDGIGNVRIRGLRITVGANQATRYIDYWYRGVGKEEWSKLSRFDTISSEGFDPYVVDPKENVVYGLQKVDGRQAAFKIKLDGSLARTPVFSRPDVDIDNFVTIGRARRIVGVGFAAEYREVHYFDPELARLSVSLRKALGGLRQVNFIDASDDESKLLVWTGSDVDPGQYFVFDKTTRKLELLTAARSALGEYKLAPVKPVVVKAADGADIPAYLTMPVGPKTKNLPAIVMPHGGPGARDEWGFDWLAQYFAQRGYVVLQPNFRGSTGYGDAWFADNGFRSWKLAIGDVTDSGRWLVQQGIADPAKLAVMGWSYGGYAALQSGATAPELFKAIIAVAPVTDLEQLKQERLHHSNYKLVETMVGFGAHISEGSPARLAKSFAAPVLLFHGGYDENVDVFQTKSMADRLKSAGKAHEVVIFPKLDHYLEDSEARATLLGKSDAFLRKAFGL